MNDEDKWADGPVEKKVPHFLKEIEDIWGFKPIPNPFHETSAMVILTSAGRTVLGSIESDPRDATLEVMCPLMFGEMVTKRNARNEPEEVGFQLTKHFFSLKALDWVLMRPDFVYFLKQDRRHDVDMVLKYSDAVTQIRGIDSDIEVVNPSGRGIIMPGAR